ncbi:MAG: cobalamin-dependent protein [Eubacteriales bacterium]|nr:cobalamin-dependent protein [Eubacteriales bacterium]MDD3350236.1 cobalamin-dependent protein [Eubacteriales bacterium]
MEDLEQRSLEFEEALLQINRIRAAEIFGEVFEKEKEFKSLESLVVTTLERIGLGWEEGSVSLSQIYMSGVICEELIEKYMPKLNIERKRIPKMAIAVLQDQHSLGKRIVSSVIRAGGYELIDFGIGQGVEELVSKTEKNEIDILLISTLMFPSALQVKELKEKLLADGYKTKIIVGGAPFRLDSKLWEKVGADADGKNASDVLRILETVWDGGEK